MAIKSNLSAAAAARPRPRRNSPSGALSLTKHVEASNRWRDQYNPQRHLTIPRVVHLIESFARGEFADLMWTLGAPYTGVESLDADLLTIVSRRTAAVVEMDWDIRTVSETRTGFDAVLADEQAAALRAGYERIENLTEAFEHFALADFRGFSLAEPIRDHDGEIARLACVPHWCVVRDGSDGAWKYNPDAMQATFASLGDELLIDEAEWFIRSSKRPVGALALVKWVRENLTEKDWDAAQEIFSLPSGVVIGPPDVPSEKEGDYVAAAQTACRGGSGYLPYGSQFVPNDFPNVVTLFKERIGHLQEKLILAGTGGALTSLSRPTGLNDSSADVQADVFQSLARQDALKISEVFQRRLDREILAANFPGKPRLAYFLIAAEEVEDTTKYIQNIVALHGAGFRADVEEVSEKTGYALTFKEPPENGPIFPGNPLPLPNTRALANGAEKEVANGPQEGAGLAPGEDRALIEALASDLAPAKAAVAAFLAKFEAGTATAADVPDLAEMFGADATAAALEKAMLEATAKEIAGAAKDAEPLKNSADECKAKDPAKCSTHGAGGANPTHVSVKDAENRLSLGEKVESSSGKKVNFGLRMLEKLKKMTGKGESEYEARMRLLDFGQEAVRSGQFIQEETNGDKRDLYYKHFDVGGKEKGILVVVSARDGEAFNLHFIKDKQAKKKGFHVMKHRSPGHDPNGQPLVALLNFIVAADEVEDRT
jgi:hypothetical protein